MKLILNNKDEMTPLERSKAIAEGKDFDRLPIDAFLGEIKARYIGKSTREYWLNEDNLVNGDIEAFNKYGLDGMGVGPNAYGIAEAIGVKAHYPEKGLICVKEHKIDKIEDGKNLDIISLKSGNLQMYYNATARLREIGDGICPVGVSLSGPITLAAFVLGTEKFLKAMVKKPDETFEFFNCAWFIANNFSDF